MSTLKITIAGVDTIIPIPELDFVSVQQGTKTLIFSVPDKKSFVIGVADDPGAVIVDAGDGSSVKIGH